MRLPVSRLSRRVNLARAGQCAMKFAKPANPPRGLSHEQPPGSAANGDNIFVAEVAGSRGFVTETAEMFGVAFARGDLYSYRAIDIRIKAAINATEPASSDFRSDFVFPDSLGHNSFPFSMA